MTNISNFGYWPTQKIIQEAANLVRWNPGLALVWMEEVQFRVDNLVLTKLWNRSVDAINKEIEDQKKFPYTEQELKDRWGNQTPRKLEQLEEIISLEDYARMSQFDEKN
jgi:hypothetical protein